MTGDQLYTALWRWCELLDFEVFEKDGLQSGGRYLPDCRRILVKHDQPEEEKPFIILHELGHGILMSVAGSEYDELKDEAVCDLFSVFTMTVLAGDVDSPVLRRCAYGLKAFHRVLYQETRERILGRIEYLQGAGGSIPQEILAVLDDLAGLGFQEPEHGKTVGREALERGREMLFGLLRLCVALSKSLYEMKGEMVDRWKKNTASSVQRGTEHGPDGGMPQMMPSQGEKQAN